MKYEIQVLPKLKKVLNKKKYKEKRMTIWAKMNEIAITLENNPNHYKNLKKPMQKFKRVHCDGSFVLIFTVDSKNKVVTFYNYKHHDDIYK